MAWLGHYCVGGNRVLPIASLKRYASLACLLVVLNGCGGQPFRWEETSYIVRQGDTLYDIAFRYGIDYRQLARWNNLQLNQTIYPGQRIRLQPNSQNTSVTTAKTTPNTTTTNKKSPAPKAKPRLVYPSPKWTWPAKGPVVAKFGDANSVGKGVDISGFVGAPIIAAAPGKVMYAGSGLRGYGKLIIIKHNDSYLSAYGHNRTLLAKQGEQVAAGQKIAEMGTGPSNRPLVHFEIRINGKAVDPLKHLPPL